MLCWVFTVHKVDLKDRIVLLTLYFRDFLDSVSDSEGYCGQVSLYLQVIHDYVYVVYVYNI